MRCASCLILPLLASVQAAPWNDGKPPKKDYVTTSALLDQLYESDLREGAAVLQGLAVANNGTRAFGTPGHVASLEYIEATLLRTNYYDVKRQYLESYQYTPTANTTFEVNGAPAANFSTPEFSPEGEVSGTVVFSGIGCESSEFPAAVSGNIALINRGTCEFGLKVALAQAAGAVGAIIADNVEATPDLPPSAVTLGEPTRPEGGYVPAVAVSLNYGQTLQQGSNTASIGVFSTTQLVSTYNVLAQTKGGDKNNIITVGAHTDSVLAGAGLNDDGSGTVSLLTIAQKLALYEVKQSVLFGFWTAEEVGLVGSTFYVNSLSQSEISKIRMNLNFDMLASPNYIYMIYDGDADVFGLSGPDGSDQIEGLFQGYFDSVDLPWNATAFDGRSDYGAFLQQGVPCGGLFTGAEEVKTEEEAARWGGTAGVAYDENYHQAGDDINNLAYDAWIVNTRAAAYAIATYATDLSGFPANNATAVVPNRKRDFQRRAGHTHAGTHAHGSCGPKTIE